MDSEPPTHPRPVLESWHDFGGEELTAVVITVHDHGAGEVHRLQYGLGIPGDLWAWVETQQDALDSAPEQFAARKHVCSERCTGWAAPPAARHSN